MGLLLSASTLNVFPRFCTGWHFRKQTTNQQHCSGLRYDTTKLLHIDMKWCTIQTKHTTDTLKNKLHICTLRQACIQNLHHSNAYCTGVCLYHQPRQDPFCDQIKPISKQFLQMFYQHLKFISYKPAVKTWCCHSQPCASIYLSVCMPSVITAVSGPARTGYKCVTFWHYTSWPSGI